MMLCPICAKNNDQKYHPFCSKRCADIDLAYWLKGNYRLSATENDVMGPEEDIGEIPECD